MGGPLAIGREIKTECTHCGGTGKDRRSGIICRDCDGKGIGKFYNTYMRTVKNSLTKRGTALCLRQYAAYLKTVGYPINNFADVGTFFKCPSCLANQSVCSADIKTLKDKLIDFILYLEADKKNLRLHTIKNLLWKVKGLYEMNEIVLPWKVIMSTLGEDTGKYKDRPYEAEEIKQIVDNSNLCYKAVVLLLASTGIRLGAFYDKGNGKYPKGQGF